MSFLTACGASSNSANVAAKKPTTTVAPTTGATSTTILTPVTTTRATTTTTKPPATTQPPATTTTSPPVSTAGCGTLTSTHLTPMPPPAPLQPFAGMATPGQGQWQPAGRLVQGHAAVYETTLQAPGTLYPTGIAWMDPNLLRATLYSGSISPGGTGWKLTAPISPCASLTLVAAFEGGYKPADSHGGYYTEGRYASPLVNGAASLVIYKNGTATVGQWGRDVSMTPDVVSVRQNLTLLVDGGKAVPGLNPDDNYVWGASLYGLASQWRAGLCVLSSGALVYVMGPGLEITQLAALLVRAGCVRAMTLDMNPDWTVFATWDPSTPGGAATSANGTRLVANTVQGPYTFFEPWWARDFITMSAR